MRRRSIWYWRWDLLLTVLLSAGIAFGAQYLYEQTLEEGYQAYLEKNAAEEGSVGAVASEDIPLAETLADMENNEYFTMEMDSITLNSNSPGGYIDGLFWHIFQLEDGTRIAAKVNSDSVVYREEGEAPMTASYARQPIGTLARESLTDDQLEELNKYHGVTVDTCYIDMEGGHATASQEDYVEYHGLLAWAAAFAAAWIIIRFVGVRTGVFPPMLPKKKKERTDLP